MYLNLLNNLIIDNAIYVSSILKIYVYIIFMNIYIIHVIHTNELIIINTYIYNNSKKTKILLPDDYK